MQLLLFAGRNTWFLIQNRTPDPAPPPPPRVVGPGRVGVLPRLQPQYVPWGSGTDDTAKSWPPRGRTPSLSSPPPTSQDKTSDILDDPLPSRKFRDIFLHFEMSITAAISTSKWMKIPNIIKYSSEIL